MGGKVIDVNFARRPGKTTRSRSRINNDQCIADTCRTCELHGNTSRGFVVGEAVGVDIGSNGRGVSAGLTAHHHGLAKMRCCCGGIGKLLRELAKHQVLAALFDKAECGNVPKHR